MKQNNSIQVANLKQCTTAIALALSSAVSVQAATVDEVLPIRHACSPTIKVWAQDMTNAQLNDTCNQLSAQESDFHNRLQTGQVPVANDYNDDLRVVVFDDYNQYDTYGYELFGINTNNGGMYIEGNPSDPNNQASFYAHEASWLRPEFEIWNLRHEYIHYLDGRFVSYGGFNHYPSNMVWWSEGLAEYLSLGTDNPEAINMVKQLRNKRRRHDLSDIFNVTYRSRVDDVYRWTYLAVRFMFERHYNEVLTMTDSLKNNNFSSYSSTLNSWSQSYENEFDSWLDSVVGSSKGSAGKTVNTKSSGRDVMLQKHSEKHLGSGHK